MPILEATKIEILDRCDEITLFGKNLEERLEAFNNRIVKIKGDMNVDIDNNLEIYEDFYHLNSFHSVYICGLIFLVLMRSFLNQKFYKNLYKEKLIILIRILITGNKYKNFILRSSQYL